MLINSPAAKILNMGLLHSFDYCKPKRLEIGTRERFCFYISRELKENPPIRVISFSFSHGIHEFLADFEDVDLRLDLIVEMWEGPVRIVLGSDPLVRFKKRSRKF